MRVLVETLHLLAGLAAALAVGWASAWSYPLGAKDIWLVTWVSMGVVLLMGVRPMLRAFRADRAKLRRGRA